MLLAISLKTEYLENPLGLGVKRPRLCWKLEGDKKGLLQTAYKIQASNDDAFASLLWDSNKVETDQSFGVLYNGPELRSMERVYWRVKVWSQSEESGFSEPVYFEMGLLNAEDWKAKWIEPEITVDIDTYKPAPFIRKDFQVKKGLVCARAYLTAKGLYSFYLNGRKGTDNLFTPGFTSYYTRLQYQAYDVTNYIDEGENTWGIILGDGWWRGSTGSRSIKNNFGYKLSFLGQLILTYSDGSREIICSDSSFRTACGPIRKSDLKDGEIYDARLEMDGWNRPGYDDSNWENVNVSKEGLESLIDTRGVPVRCRENFSPTVIYTPNGETVLDFGQNIAGWVEMKVSGPRGTEVTLIHGEALDKNGNFTLKNILMKDSVEDYQVVQYIVKGEGIEQYQPYFAFFGFQYVLLKNYPGEVKPENFRAKAIYSVMEETGNFRCSNPLINQLVSNAIWSQKGNFLEVPTDCPTREKAGWTGDAQIYCRTASDFMNVYPFFERWMEDVAQEQYPSGKIRNTVPDVYWHNYDEQERFFQLYPDLMTTKISKSRTLEDGSLRDGSAGWGDAAVIIPWVLYLCYGEKKILQNQYASARAWVDYIATCAKTRNECYKDTPAYNTYTDGELDADYIWDTKFHWGEWLEPDIDIHEQYGGLDNFVAHQLKYADPLVGTTYFAYSTRLLAQIANALGKQDDQEKYAKLYEKIQRIYNKYFIQEDGTILEGRQAPYVRTLAFDLAYEDKKPAVARKLAEIVKQSGYHLNTGFLSTPYLLHALADNGYTDAAFQLLEQDTYPSWLYTVKKGATTIWEKWTGILPDGEISGSFNHYAYGAVCDFLFSVVAGIKPVWEKPGYKNFVIQPMQGGTLTHACAEYESFYGLIKSEWEKTGEGTKYFFTVPPNTTAMIMLPGSQNALEKVTSEFKEARYENGFIVFEAGSGEYSLTVEC